MNITSRTKAAVKVDGTNENCDTMTDLQKATQGRAFSQNEQMAVISSDFQCRLGV